MHVRRAFIKASEAQAGMTVDPLNHGNDDFTKNAAQLVSGRLKRLRAPIESKIKKKKKRKLQLNEKTFCIFPAGM